MWWNGPSWLNQPEKQWPDQKTPAMDINHQQLFEGELREGKILFEAKLVSGEIPSKEFQISKNLSDIDIKRFSLLHKFLRVTAWLLRFVDKLLKKGITTGPITAVELKLARRLWEQQTQYDYYSDVIWNVKGGKRNNVQHQLNLQLDTDGLLKCQGRLGNAELTKAAKQPKLPPKDAYFTRLVIEDAHSRVLHSGVSQTLSTIRQEYWIPQGRAVVKKLKYLRIVGYAGALKEPHLLCQNARLAKGEGGQIKTI